MNELLSLPERSRRALFEDASAQLGMPASSIEKDYWVTLVLDALFSSEQLRSRLTFKGGTSLSKAFHFIERFSEDIDIVIERRSLGFTEKRDPELAATRSARERLVEELKTACAKCVRKEILPVIATVLGTVAGAGTFQVVIDDDDEDGQTLLVGYDSLFGTRQLTYIRPSVKVELGARSGNEPITEADVHALLDEAQPGARWVGTVRVQALDPRRTFLEKAFLVHEENKRPPGKQQKQHMSRHLYDLSCLVKAKVGAEALLDSGLFQKILLNRKTFFRYSWIDYSQLAAGAASLRLVPPGERMDAWRRDYDELSREMIYGKAPDFAEMVSDIREIERLASAAAAARTTEHDPPAAATPL